MIQSESGVPWGERQEMIRQSSYLGPLTALMLRDAGLSLGMNLLDVGCGRGGLVHIAADIVGEAGLVVGLDRDEATLAVARDLARDQGLHQVTFVMGALANAKFQRPFDLVAGRFMLVHQSDPLLFVRQVAALVRKGGSVAFIEPDFTARAITWPEVPEIERAWGYVREVFIRSGLAHDMGLRLHHTLQQAGLRDVHLRGEVHAGGGPDFFGYEWIAQAARSLAPKMERLGIATAAEVMELASTETFRARALALGAQVQLPPIMAAWGSRV